MYIYTYIHIYIYLFIFYIYIYIYIYVWDEDVKMQPKPHFSALQSLASCCASIAAACCSICLWARWWANQVAQQSLQHHHPCGVCLPHQCICHTQQRLQYTIAARPEQKQHTKNTQSSHIGLANQHTCASAHVC